MNSEPGMTPSNWIAIAAIITPLLVGGIVALIGLAMVQRDHAQKLREHGEWRAVVDVRLRSGDEHMSRMETSLAVIVEGVEWLKEMLGRRKVER